MKSESWPQSSLSFCWVVQWLVCWRVKLGVASVPRGLCCVTLSWASSPLHTATLKGGGHVSHCREPFDHRLRPLSLVTALVYPNFVVWAESIGSGRAMRNIEVYDFKIGISSRPNIALPMCIHGTLHAMTLAANETKFQLLFQ